MCDVICVNLQYLLYKPGFFFWKNLAHNLLKKISKSLFWIIVFYLKKKTENCNICFLLQLTAKTGASINSVPFSIYQAVLMRTPQRIQRQYTRVFFLTCQQNMRSLYEWEQRGDRKKQYIKVLGAKYVQKISITQSGIISYRMVGKSLCRFGCLFQQQRNSKPVSWHNDLHANRNHCSIIILCCMCLFCVGYFVLHQFLFVFLLL